jgi:hypothetical protein
LYPFTHSRSELAVEDNDFINLFRSSNPEHWGDVVSGNVWIGGGGRLDEIEEVGGVPMLNAEPIQMPNSITEPDLLQNSGWWPCYPISSYLGRITKPRADVRLDESDVWNLALSDGAVPNLPINEPLRSKQPRKCDRTEHEHTSVPKTDLFAERSGHQTLASDTSNGSGQVPRERTTWKRLVNIS